MKPSGARALRHCEHNLEWCLGSRESDTRWAVLSVYCQKLSGQHHIGSHHTRLTPTHFGLFHLLDILSSYLGTRTYAKKKPSLKACWFFLLSAIKEGNVLDDYRHINMHLNKSKLSSDFIAFIGFYSIIWQRGLLSKALIALSFKKLIIIINVKNLYRKKYHILSLLSLKRLNII